MSNLNFASQRPPTHRAPRRGGQAGFSLMEAMVVATIVAIMAVLAVPSFSGMVQRQRVKNAADAVLSDLRWARSEAIKRGQDVTVKFSNLKTGTWQYVVSVPDATEPSGTKIIKGPVSQDAFPSVVLSRIRVDGCQDHDATEWTLAFDHVRGEVLPRVGGNGGVEIIYSDQRKVVVISSIGRAKISNC